MDKEMWCAIGGAILALSFLALFMLSLIYSGEQFAETQMMESCDKLGRVELGEFTYKCEVLK